MTLRISSSQLQAVEQANFHAWLRSHVDALTDLLPDVASAFPSPLFERRVEALLRRADLHGMYDQVETIPYCFAALTLGFGFESQPQYGWAPAAMRLQGQARGEAIWDGLEASAASTMGET